MGADPGGLKGQGAEIVKTFPLMGPVFIMSKN